MTNLNFSNMNRSKLLEYQISGSFIYAYLANQIPWVSLKKIIKLSSKQKSYGKLWSLQKSFLQFISIIVNSTIRRLFFIEEFVFYIKWIVLLSIARFPVSWKFLTPGWKFKCRRLSSDIIQILLHSSILSLQKQSFLLNFLLNVNICL